MNLSELLKSPDHDIKAKKLFNFIDREIRNRFSELEIHIEFEQEAAINRSKNPGKILGFHQVRSNFWRLLLSKKADQSDIESANFASVFTEIFGWQLKQKTQIEVASKLIIDEAATLNPDSSSYVETDFETIPFSTVLYYIFKS